MAKGRATQTRLNILTALTLAAAIALGFSLTIIWTAFSPWIFVLLGIVILLGMVSVFAHRCPQCGHDVTKNAQGVRTHKRWPKVNETCANCGADLL
jgi:fatty acid desaturase